MGVTVLSGPSPQPGVKAGQRMNREGGTAAENRPGRESREQKHVPCSLTALCVRLVLTSSSSGGKPSPATCKLVGRTLFSWMAPQCAVVGGILVLGAGGVL